MELDVSHVLVTGASGALGGAVVKDLLGRGVRVTAVASPGRLESSAALGKSGGRLLLLEGNVSSLVECERLCSQAEAALNPLDGVVACAGGWRGGRPLWEAPEAELEEMMTRNFRTAFHTLRAGAHRMVVRRRGRLVAVASEAALAPAANAAAYAISKAAVVQTVRALAKELHGSGVVVNCIAPGTMDTPANRAAMPNADPTRWVNLGDAVAAIRMLLSKECAATTGAVLPLPAA